MSNGSPTALLLNAGHALDHLFLLIFATAVAAIAADWGMLWQDLMPYTLGAFLMFGVGSLPAGRLGDLWGRRAMMIVFFVGMGLSALLVAFTHTVWRQLGGCLPARTNGQGGRLLHPVAKHGRHLGVHDLVRGLASLARGSPRA
jgi:MFS family permease